MELTPQIPIIDISVWSNHGERESEAARSCVAKEWNAALVEFGCAVIVGHGIDERIFRKINEESSTFFCSSIESKLRYNYGSYGHPCGGYTAPGNEIVAMSSEQMDDAELNGSKPKYDPVENFVFTTLPRNFVSPCGDPAPFDSAADYYQIMENTLTILHRLSCAALGMSDLNYFEQFYDASLPGNERKGRNGNCLRLAHYPPIDVSMVKGRSHAHISIRLKTKLHYLSPILL